MVLGLLPEAYVVYYCPFVTGTPEVAAISGSLLFFRSYQDAKDAAENFLALRELDNLPPPQYLWIEPIYKLWIDGQS